MTLIPFGTRPHLVDKVWGGARLAPGTDRQVGEAWLVADLDAGVSATSLESDLSSLVKAHHGALGAQAGGRFPLLVKLLDAAKDLSIQVHPDEPSAAKIPGATAKDELWVITAATPRASVLYGFKPGVTRDDFMTALEKKRPEKAMNRIPVRDGDVLRIAPGTVHAVCGGVSLLEVQEPSDTTFRVWDYQRPGLDGELRPLHLEQALASANFGDLAPAPLPPQVQFEHGRLLHEILFDGPRYRVERVSSGGQCTWALPPSPVRVVVPLKHEAIIGAGDDALHVEAQSAAVVPRGWTGTLRARGDVIVTSPPATSELLAVEVSRG